MTGGNRGALSATALPTANTNGPVCLRVTHEALRLCRHTPIAGQQIAMPNSSNRTNVVIGQVHVTRGQIMITDAHYYRPTYGGRCRPRGAGGEVIVDT
jgi:hypothetical protein